MIRGVLSCAIVYVLATPAHPQSAVDRAIAAGSAVGGPEHLMQEDLIDDVLLPYQTNAPAEGGMSHHAFEDEIADVREQDDDQGRALRATEDSYAIRPDVDIDGQGELFDDANWAHENADDVAGHYFSSETGSCETVSLPVTDLTDHFCSASPAEVSETCDLVRRVWVDRWDTYRCDKRAATYVEVCELPATFACHQANGQGGCVQQNIQFTGGTVTWNGDEATLHFDAPENATAYIARHDFSISVSDHFVPEEMRLIRINAGGASQLTRPNQSGPGLEVIETFYDGTLQGLGTGGVCPSNDEAGLLIPTSHTWAGGACGGNTQTSFAVGIFADLLPNNDVDLRSYLTNRSYYTREDYVCAPVYNPVCASAQGLPASANMDRNLLRWLSVPAPTLPVPGNPKVWMDTEFTLRVIAEPGQQHASLTFKFIGSCCDSFINVGVEQCQ